LPGSGPDFGITHLLSGGLITNYYCSSRCRHCLYGCSPRWKRRYIDEETARTNIETIAGLGCRSIHIGGGEPLLDPQALENVLEVTGRLGMAVEYVETNSSWYRDADSACRVLGSLRDAGLHTLLVSISPFHNEFIPFRKVKGVIRACRTVGVRVFPWIWEFYREIDSFDDRTVHKIEEYEERFGKSYVAELPSRYWIHLGGRALSTFSRAFPRMTAHEIISTNPSGCRELLDVGHFHVDLFGNYIPGLCSGLAIRRADLGTGLSSESYPLLTTLFTEGIKGLYELITHEHRFAASRKYISKCDLCLDMRSYLVLECGIESRELQPLEFYLNLSRRETSTESGAPRDTE
jgi:hypothetical protein